MQLNVGAGSKKWTPYVPPPKPKQQIPASLFTPAVFYTPKGEVTLPQAVKTVVSGTPQLAKKAVQTVTKKVTKPKTTTPPKPAAPKAPAAPPAPLTGYAKHVAGFGSEQAYAAAIKAAEASGRPLSDPAAAAAFKAAHPELFQAPSRTTTGTWSAPASGGGYAAPVAAPPKPAAAPTTAPPAPTVRTPQEATPEVPTVRTPQEATPEVPTTDDLLNNTVMPVVRQVQELFNSVPDDSKALLAQLQADYLASLDSLQATIMKQFQDQLGGVDPATQNALQSIRQQAAQLQTQLEEEMNRRGLLQSGIWVEARIRLQSGQLSAEQALLAERVKSLQDQMNQALMNFAQARLGAIQTFGLEGVRLAEQRAQTAREAISAGLSAGLSLADMQRAMQEAARNYGLNLSQFEWQKSQDLWERQQAEKQQAFEEKKWQDQLKLENQRLAQSASSSGRASGGRASSGGGTSATAQLLAALPSYGTREAAIADITAHAGELRAMGVNVDALLNAAMQLPSGQTSGGFGGGSSRGAGASR